MNRAAAASVADLRRLADLRLSDLYSTATHSWVPRWCRPRTISNVIDGQHRLTTLQLLMDAAGSVLDEDGMEAPSGQLQVLTRHHGRHRWDG